MQQYQVEFSPKADKELLGAFAWYEERQPDLGVDFLQKVSQKINIIVSHPERYSKVKGMIRQVSVTRFPYAITYYIKPRLNKIIIVSVFHHSRNPNDKFR